MTNAQHNICNTNPFQNIYTSQQLKCLKTAQSKPSKSQPNYEMLSAKEIDELNDYIGEYLLFHGYSCTINEFERERQKTNEILNKIISMFDSNDIDGIFKVWNGYLSKQILSNDPFAVRIECQLHILKFVNNYKTKDNHKQTELHRYFNENGQRLAICEELLPYFGLPFIENAHLHPVFASLFDKEFVVNLRSQLIDFLLKSPKLHSVFANYKERKEFQLNYDKIHKRMNAMDDRTHVLLLLQSLRWRVTKIDCIRQKRNIISQYIANDIFSFEIISRLFSLKHTETRLILLMKETMLRLLNVVTSFAIGRSCLYLMNVELIHILCDVLTQSNNDDAIRMNALGVLQKLSLRRSVQDIMIEKGLIGWIISMLNEFEDVTDLSRYTLEYSTALLMNLTLRSRNKKNKQFQLNKQHIHLVLQTLLKLLNSAFIAEIHTYCTAVLYSMLSEPNIHEIAIEINLENELNKCWSKYNDACFKQQIDYIISQLPLTHVKQENIDDCDDAANEDYSENEDYQETDVDELIGYLSEKNIQCVQGDAFLFNEYKKCR